MRIWLAWLSVACPALFGIACSGPSSAPGEAGGASAGGSSMGGSSAGGTGASSGTAATGGSQSTAGTGGAQQPGTGGSAGSSAGGSDSGAGGTAGTGGVAPDTTFCDSALDAAAVQYQGFLDAYQDPASIPRSFKDGALSAVAPGDWTSGFDAGSLWYLYEHTGEQAYRTAAEAWTAALTGAANDTGSHDVGFVINSSFGNGLRLTENSAYETVLITAGGSLNTRFSATVGATRSWSWGGWSYPVIVDNMMNLEVMFRASALGGDAAYGEHALAHALTTDANHFREDSSSYHLINYDAATGAVISKETYQGLANESSWARGQAWGLYGFTMAYRETSNTTLLARALSIAEYLVNSPDIPEDGVPYFDFSAPTTDGVEPLRDASAAAVIASALLELQGFAEGEARQRYRDFALHLLGTLGSSDYTAASGENGHFILMHSVGNYPQGGEIDVAMNYADYYYLEALLRCTALE